VLGILLLCQHVRLSLLRAAHSIAEPNTLGDLGNFQLPPSANFPSCNEIGGGAAGGSLSSSSSNEDDDGYSTQGPRRGSRIQPKKMKIMKTKHHNIMFRFIFRRLPRDPAFDNPKANAQEMIGKFAVAYSFDTDRDGNILDWRFQGLLSLLLPYLGKQDVTHLLSTNSLIFNACQQCICYVSEVKSLHSNQYEPRAE
jgi:hypothetical protein